MNRYIHILFSVVLLFIAASSQAAIEVYRFKTADDEAQYNQLIHELRCLVCQNQNLADSNAELARDLRNQVYRMTEEGARKDEIVSYMVARYGDFVRYRPPFNASTLLLWTGPLLLVLAGMFMLIRHIRQSSTTPAEPLTSEQRKQLDELLKQPTNTQHERQDQ
jgi:cytochrome c-type biogenesis protein CcmH